MKTYMKSIAAVVIASLFATADVFAQSPSNSGETVTVRVDGLSCPFCALGLEKNLKKIEGVTGVSIKLEEGTATLEVKVGENPSDEEITRRVKDAGFTPREIKRELPQASSSSLEFVTLKIEGMVCPNCEKNVHNTLANVNGVSQVHVDQEKGEAMVAFDKSLTTPDKLIKAVEDVGLFEAQVKD